MNNGTNVNRDIYLDYKQIFWDILSQWKIVLIVALAAGILVLMFKYNKDQAAYKARMDEEPLNAELEEEDAEEYLNKMYQNLPENDRDAVMYLLGLEEEIILQQCYLKESLLMNSAPTNQRFVLLNYYLKTAAGMDIQAISDSYAQSLNSNQLQFELGKAISPETDTKYIAELVSAVGGNLPDSEMTGQILRVRVILTEESDASAVERAISSVFAEKNKTLAGSMGEHTISLVDVIESHRVAVDVIDKKATMYNTMNASQNNIKTYYQQLNNEQKKVVDIGVSQLRTKYNLDMTNNEDIQGMEISNETEPEEKPHIRPVFAILGFILGIAAYAFIYTICLILRRKLVTSDNAGYYTNSRLIGEVVNANKKYRGLDVLAHSHAVDKLRYRGKGSIEEQIEKIASRILAVCNHANASAVTLVCLTQEGSDSREVSERIQQAIINKGLKARLLVNNGDVNEDDMLDLHNAVSVVDRDSRPQNIANMLQLYKEYDTKQLGCVYVGEV